MDDSSPSKRITRGFMAKTEQVQDKKYIEELRSKKKNDPIAIQKVINNANASDIKIVDGGSKRKVINSDSEEIESASSDLDKSEEHHEHNVRYAVDHVNMGTDALQTAKSLQKKSRKCMMIAIILLLIIAAIIVLSVIKPWKK